MDLGSDNQRPQRQPEASPKRVSFASDIPPDTPTGSQNNVEIPPPKLDGVIGKLEIYQSGAIKMRLGNILYDVSPYVFQHSINGTNAVFSTQVAAGTQASFLQHAVHLDLPNKRLCVLGEVSKRFVVSPNIDALLAALDQADQESNTTNLAADNMDTK